MKIALSGGHLTPALAFIDYLRATEAPHSCVFFGREHAQLSTAQPSHEAEEVQARGVNFIPFTAGKVSSYNPLELLVAAAQTVKAFCVAIYYLVQEKPDVYLSFGSYLAVPLGYAAWVLGIPVVTHEQTRSIGFATKALAPIARQIFLSFTESEVHLPRYKTEVVGNLIRASLSTYAETPPSWYHNPQNLPILYVTGGSQGSEVINTCMSRLITKLVKEWVVVHQCGSSSQARSYSSELTQVRSSLPRTHQSRYSIQEWISAEELGWLYSHSTVVVGRAGANTVQELAAFRVPSVLIPLPFSHHNEQFLNASWLAEKGGAEVIEQKDLTADILLEKIEAVASKHKAYRRRLKELEVPTQAAAKVLEALEHMVSQ